MTEERRKQERRKQVDEIVKANWESLVPMSYIPTWWAKALLDENEQCEKENNELRELFHEAAEEIERLTKKLESEESGDN